MIENGKDNIYKNETCEADERKDHPSARETEALHVLDAGDKGGGERGEEKEKRRRKGEGEEEKEKRKKRRRSGGREEKNEKRRRFSSVMMPEIIAIQW